MSEIPLMAVRTWKRDGSQDVMDLKSAVESLAYSGCGITGSSVERKEAIRQALLEGKELETQRATFMLQS